VIDGALRAIAVAASALIALSFALFAVEQVSDASRAQESAIVDPGAAQERTRASGHTRAREAVDDVNDALLRPFAGAVDGSGNQWVQRGVPALLGLLVYGFGLTFLARALKARSRRLVPHHRPRATATGSVGASKPPPGPS
jgi:hypothetical protein